MNVASINLEKFFGSDAKDLFFWKLLITSGLSKINVKFKIINNNIVINKNDYSKFAKIVDNIINFSTNPTEMEKKNQLTLQKREQQLDEILHKYEYKNTTGLAHFRERYVVNPKEKQVERVLKFRRMHEQWLAAREKINDLYEYLLSEDLSLMQVNSMLGLNINLHYGKRSLIFDFKYLRDFFDFDFFQKCNLEQKKQLLNNLFFNDKILIESIKELRKFDEKVVFKIIYESDIFNVNENEYRYVLAFEDENFVKNVQTFLHKNLVCCGESSLNNILINNFAMHEKKLILKCTNAHELENWQDFLKIYQIYSLLKRNLVDAFVDFKFDLEIHDGGVKHLKIFSSRENGKVIFYQGLFSADVVQVCEKVNDVIDENTKKFSTMFSVPVHMPNIALESDHGEKGDKYTFLYIFLCILMFLTGIGIPVAITLFVCLLQKESNKLAAKNTADQSTYQLQEPFVTINNNEIKSRG